VTKTQLIRQFGIPEASLKQLEDHAIRECKERETKLQVEELLCHLEFSDITDFNDLTQIKDFIEYNFYSEENVSDNATENESCSEDIDGGFKHH
jgi:hypothetical protein